jgi:16S rRNA G966 N2-methylase RsmD
MCDSLKEIKKVNEKFDMIFLDIPYKTKAVI